MSIAAFIIGLLVWFSVPAFFKRNVGGERWRMIKTVGKWAGIFVIISGIFHGI